MAKGYSQFYITGKVGDLKRQKEFLAITRREPYEVKS